MPAPLTVTDAAAIIARRWPGRRVESIEVLGEGDFCTGFLVDRAWVFRFAKHDRAAASLRREASLLPKLAGRFHLEIPAPQIIELNGDPPFVGYHALPGPALHRSDYLRLSEPHRDRCASQIGAFLAQMHATDPMLAERCGVEYADYAAQYAGLSKQVGDVLSSNLSTAEHSLVKRTISDLLNAIGRKRYRPTLLHGDLSPDHVLYDPDAPAVTAVIDFGDMIIGDPAWEFVCPYEDYGPDFLGRALRAYGSADSASLLVRMYDLYLLGAIEWTVQQALRGSEAGGDIVIRMIETLNSRESQLEELLSLGP